MSIGKLITIAVIAIGGIWFIVGFVSTLEAAHSYYERRGTIMRWVGLLILSRWFALSLFLGGLCFLYYLQKGVPSWIWDRSLKMTVTNYRYSSETKELIATVQFVNNGQVRRIIVGAMFTYKPPPALEQDQDQTQNQRHYIIESMEELHSHGDLENPIYVEPGEPIIATFRRKVLNDAPLKTPGTVFGIQISSLTATGGSNMTWVDVMEAISDQGDPTKAIGFVTGRKETISLDEPWGNNPMETQSQLRAQIEVKETPPAAQLSVAPSATAKSALDRIKILDTPDGPILSVEALDTTPTATPQPKPPENLTPRQLFALIEGRTPLQVVKLIAPYKNLWTEAEGELNGQISPHGDGCIATLLLDSEGKQMVECRFAQRWCDQLDSLKAKSIIKVRGKIGTHYGVTLVLSEGELVSTTPP